VTGKTITICHWLDIVCGVGPLANPIPHLLYEPTETNAMGRWVADRLP
jgi:hypothetical protein